MIYEPTYLAAFLLGFFGSLHCLGMCGPIALVVPPLGKDISGRIAGGVVYSLGRILTYGSLGIIAGLIGRGFVIFQYQQTISIIMGLAIILYALTPEVFSAKQFNRLTFGITNNIKVVMGKYLKKGTVPGLLTIGIANGLLPCGFVYLGLAGSVSTGNFFSGALFMTFFGLGTVPMMTGVYFMGNGLNKVKVKLTRILPFVTFFFGLLFILRGLGLGIPFVSPDLVTGNKPSGHCIVNINAAD